MLLSYYTATNKEGIPCMRVYREFSWRSGKKEIIPRYPISLVVKIRPKG